MKKLVFGLSLLLSSFITPSLAEEFNNFYLTIAGGLAFPSDVEGDSTLGGTIYEATFETDKTGFLSVGLGKKFKDIRLEFNYSNLNVETDSFKITNAGSGVAASISPNLEAKVNSYMLYGYKDFRSESKISPYAGIGIGIASLSADEQEVTVAETLYKLDGASNTVFSYGIKGGVAYEISHNTSIYTEGTFQNFASYDVSEVGYETVNYDSTNFLGVSAGLRINF